MRKIEGYRYRENRKKILVGGLSELGGMGLLGVCNILQQEQNTEMSLPMLVTAVLVSGMAMATPAVMAIWEITSKLCQREGKKIKKKYSLKELHGITTPDKAMENLNPAEKVEIKLIDGVPVLEMWGIPMAEDTAEYFYGDSMKAGTRFDLVSVDLDEFSGRFLADRNIHYRTGGDGFERILFRRKFVDEYRDDYLGIGKGNELSGQLMVMEILLASIFCMHEFYPELRRKQDQIVLNELKQDLRSEPGKRLIIILGHEPMDIDGNVVGVNLIGDNEKHITLERLFDEIKISGNPGGYAAMLLIRCNGNGGVPPQLQPGVKRYYIKGISGVTGEKIVRIAK